MTAKRQLSFFVLATGVWLFSNGQQDRRTGMLYGPDFVFYMTAPPGWVLDNRSGINQGIHMIFYPEGNRWEESPVVAYAQSVPLSEEIRSVEDLVRKALQDFKRRGKSSIRSLKQKTIPLAKGGKAEIYYYRGDRGANHEAVGYILEKMTINYLVYSAREKSVFEANLDKFGKILQSYKNVFREDDRAYGKDYFSTLTAKAEEDRSTAQGKEYEALLIRTQKRKVEEQLKLCLADRGLTGEIPKIEMVFVIGGSGEIGDSYVWPVTALSVCVKGLVAGLKMPSHKLGKFYHYVFLDITAEDRFIDAPSVPPSQEKWAPGAPKEAAEFLKIGSFGPNDSSAPGFLNAYEYWASFKPGSFVRFRVLSSREGETRTVIKTFTVTEVTPEKAVIECQESVNVGQTDARTSQAARTAAYTFAVWADTPVWEREDLFHGFLSLSLSNLYPGMPVSDISDDAEELEIKGANLRTRRVEFRLPSLGAGAASVTAWFAEEIPGGLARHRREVSGPAFLKEEICVEDFRADKREAPETRQRAHAPESLMKASTYLGRNLRFFREARRVEEDLVGLAGYAADYQLFFGKIEELLERAREWKAHFKDDVWSINIQLSESERRKLEPFVRQAAEYCSSFVSLLDNYHQDIRNLMEMPNPPASLVPSLTAKLEEFGAAKNNAYARYISARNELKSMELMLAK